MIRDGKLAELVKPVVLAGNLFETLDRVDAVAGDFRWNQLGGGCGKGGQVPLPVAEGAPHIRLSEVAGRWRSSDRAAAGAGRAPNPGRRSRRQDRRDSHARLRGRPSEVGRADSQERGVNLRVVAGGRMGFAGTTDADPEPSARDGAGLGARRTSR